MWDAQTARSSKSIHWVVAPWLISSHPVYSVMSFIGYGYKKNKEPAESSQDLNTLDTYTMLADD